MSPLDHSNVRWGTEGQATWVCKLPGTLRGRCFWNSVQLFGLSCSLGSGLMGTWRYGQDGAGQPWRAKCGLRGATPEVSRGQSQTKPKVPGGQRPVVNLLQMESQGQGSWHHWPTGQGGSLLPMGSAHHTIPMQPGVRTGAGSLHCPSRYVNKGKKTSSQKPRVPQLETWSSRCGWGGGGNISAG